MPSPRRSGAAGALVVAAILGALFLARGAATPVPAAPGNGAGAPGEPPRAAARVAAVPAPAAAPPAPAPHPVAPPAVAMAPDLDLGAVMEQARLAWRADGGGWRGDHPTFSAVRRGDGVLEVTPRHHDARAGLVTGSPVGFAPARITRGRATLADGAGTVRGGEGGQLEIGRGDVVEVLRNDPAGVEQSWRLDGPPQGRGDLEVRIALSSGRLVAEDAGGLHLAAGSLGVSYGHGRWIDAAGAEAEVPARWEGGAIVLRVPEDVLARSRWPAVLDPAIGPEQAVGAPVDASAGFRGQNTPAVAVAGGDYLVVWVDMQSGQANHIYGARVSGSDGAVLDAVAICTVAATQAAPAVASDGTDYLVVWEDYRASAPDIYGAIVKGTTGAVATAPGGFPLSTAVGRQTAPSVSFDATSHHYLVVWEDARAVELGAPQIDFDVYGARVTQAGAVLDANGFLVTGGSGYQGAPVVAWEGAFHLVSFLDTSNADGIPRIFGQRVDDSGGTYGAPVTIGAFAGGNTSPGVTAGAGEWLVVWDVGASPRSAYGALVWYSAATAYVSGSILHQLAEGAAATRPAAAWNGHHFLAAWRDPATGDLVGVRMGSTGHVADPDPFVIATSVRNAPRDVTVTRLGSDFLVGYTTSDPDLHYRAHVRRVAGNRPPVASQVTITIPEDTTRVIPATELASDPDGDGLTVTWSPPGHGDATGQATAALTYTPKPNFNGSDQFFFEVGDGLDATGLVTITIVVTPVNDVPQAQPQALATDEDTSLDVTLVATDVETPSASLVYAIVAPPAHGTLSGTPPAVVYTPAKDYAGIDQFTFEASDGAADSPHATVTITVRPVNDPPVAHDGTCRVRPGVSVPVILNGEDVDGTALHYTILTQPAHGTLAGAGSNFTYTPAAGFTGNDGLTFKVSDGELESGVATVTITVAEPDAVRRTLSAYGCSSGGGAAGLLPLALLALALAPRVRRRRAVRSLAAAALAAALAAGPARAAAPATAPPPPASARPASKLDVPLPPPPVLRPAPRPAPAAAPAASPRKPARLRVAVMPIRPGLGVESAMAALVTDALVAEVTDRGVVAITSKDVQAALGFERERQMLGCADDGCLAQIAGALGADRVVFGDLAQVQGLTIFSAQVFDTRAGAVERRFHERMAGGDAEDLLDATGRAAAELFPGLPRTGTASRRRSVLTATSAHPFALVLRGGADVQQAGGFGVLMLEVRAGRSLRLGVGPMGAGTKTLGAALRVAWAPIALDHLSVYAALEGQLLFPKDVVAGGAVALGLEWAFTQRLALAVEAPYVFLASAPATYRTSYFMPGLALAWRF